MTTKTQFKLSRPTQAHGEEIDTLWLREPNAGDLAATGEPFVIKNMDAMAEASAAGRPIAPEFQWNTPALIALITRIASVPRSTVASLTWGDLFKLEQVIAGFFAEQVATDAGLIETPTATTTAPTATPATPPSSIQPIGSARASASPVSGDALPPTSLRSVGMS